MAGCISDFLVIYILYVNPYTVANALLVQDHKWPQGKQQGHGMDRVRNASRIGSNIRTSVYVQKGPLWRLLNLSKMQV
jgi:hypothetical protein